MAQACNQNLKRNGLPNSVQPNNLLGSFSPVGQQMRGGYSSLSLASATYLMEEKLQNEMKKLQSELKTEKEKNDALNSQLNINSNLMAAFEQSLTTLNTRLRQMTTLNEKKDAEIEQLTTELTELKASKSNSEQSADKHNEQLKVDVLTKEAINNGEETKAEDEGEAKLLRIIEDLRRQLIAKDRLLTDTRLEALSAAHQLEQLESKYGADHNIVVNDEDLDEGVMVTNHSPSDSDAITDSAHFSEINSQISKNTPNRSDNSSTPFEGLSTMDNQLNGSSNQTGNPNECALEQKHNNYELGSLNYENRNDHYQDNQSSNSSDLHTDDKNCNQHVSSEASGSAKMPFNEFDSSILVEKMKNNLLAIN